MDNLPSPSQFYARIIDEARENIQRLEQSIFDMTPIYQKELAKETIEKDYAWWESIGQNPSMLDWGIILNDTKTSPREFRQYIPLYGLSGGTVWMDVAGQRVVSFSVHKERPEVLPLYAELMSAMAPYMKPRSSGTVDWSLGKQNYLSLDRATGKVSIKRDRNPALTYSSLLDALTDYHMHYATSMFDI